MQTAKYIKTGTFIQHKDPSTRSPLFGFENKDIKALPAFKQGWILVNKPHINEATSHKHDFDQLLCFFGTDFQDMLNLSGVVEIDLSEDGVNMEKHVFKNSTSVFIPKGLYHCPLIFKEVNKPILFMNILFTEDYKRT